MSYTFDILYMCQFKCYIKAGWPQHRENREFGCQFFQTGKTQGIWLQHREKNRKPREKILTCLICTL